MLCIHHHLAILLTDAFQEVLNIIVGRELGKQAIGDNGKLNAATVAVSHPVPHLPPPSNLTLQNLGRGEKRQVLGLT